MRRRTGTALAFFWSLLLAGCGAVGAIVGGSGVTSVTVGVPAGLLVGDSAQAHASATKDNGNVIPDLTPDAWRSSDPTVISINSHGVIKALIAGRSATIYADYQGKTGSAVVTVGSDDSRLAYALADQPSAAAPYVPDPVLRFSTSGGAITVTRTATGSYTVSFAGLGRPPGGRDNVQVTTVAGGPIYCKAASWDASGADLVATVRCVRKDASLADSKFSILALGARAFGASTPLGFLVWNGDVAGTVSLDTSLTAYNSAGGKIDVGHVSDGNYATILEGLGTQSGGVTGPVGFIASGTGNTARRCQLNGYDLAGSGNGITCRNSGGGFSDAAFSLLWFTRGRPGFRYGYAFANNAGNTAGYAPPSDLSKNSSGGAITAKRIAAGTYQVSFAGLAHAAGATEAVQVSVFGQGGPFCTLVSWGNGGANELVVNVTCWDTLDLPADAPFNVLIVQ